MNQTMENTQVNKAWKILKSLGSGNRHSVLQVLKLRDNSRDICGRSEAG